MRTLLMHAIVHAADIPGPRRRRDADGDLVRHLSVPDQAFADGGYRGARFQSAVARILPRVTVKIVKRSDLAKGFAVVPKRWIVERSLACFGRCRRLAKDWECLNRRALTFLRLASIRLMLRNLCNPT
jgi:transposase